MNRLTANDILSYIDEGLMAFHRSSDYYTWNRDNVIDYLKTIYCNRECGTIVLAEASEDKDVSVIMDGTQRVKTLYGLVRGLVPEFFEGNATTLTGLWFNYDTEQFAYYNKDMEYGKWVSVSDCLSYTDSKMRSLCKDMAGKHAYHLLKLYNIKYTTFNCERL
ncbi:MAG: DUF262 domain-containing protein [Paludibacteraceae bacterium]|nr:DUF262 domain-containing protein [Paludibacteraceae bacterium]